MTMNGEVEAIESGGKKEMEREEWRRDGERDGEKDRRDGADWGRVRASD